MTGDQARAARGLLGWSRMRLSSRAGIPEHALAIFESTGRMQLAMHGNTDRTKALHAALEAAGVEFTNGDAAGVRLTSRPAGGAGSVGV